MVNLYNNIPQYVKENGLFCCWKYEERKGKQSKVPYNALTDKYASSDKPETFTDFEKACSAAAEGNYDGIGLGIFGDICAIDIDDCIPEKGKLTKLANDVVAMMQSYAEVSPSGKGVRILFQAKDFPYDKDLYYIMNQGRKMEVYVAGATSKYVTVTGNRIDKFPISFGDRSENLQSVLDLYMKKDKNKKKDEDDSKDVAVNGKFAVNGEMVVNDGMPERAFHAKNGAKFERLYNGDTSDYKSWSEADLGLCGQLAFWTQKNPKRMDELFRGSGLMRPKWDEKRDDSTYGEDTIQLAIEGCKNIAPPYTGLNEGGDEFLPIKDLDTQGYDLPPFPVEALPAAIGAYVNAVSKHSQTPPDMAGTLSLGVLAVCVQGKYQIEGNEGYYEPLSLYTVVIADPGARKSSTMAAMTKCLYEYEDAYNKAHQKELRANEIQRAKLEKQLKALEEKLGTEGDEGIDQEILDVQVELDEIPVIKPLRLLADDVSMEALTSLLASHNGRMGVVSAEGGAFDNIRGRYSPVQNIDVWLKGHCGDPIMIDRLGRNAEKISNPHLSAILAIQPYVLEEIMKDEKLGGRGLLARFLYSTLPPSPEKQSFGAPGIPEDVKTEYSKLIGKLLDIPLGEEPKTLKLSKEAFERMEAFFDEHQDYLRGEGQIILEWASKYIGAVLRIAGLIHLADDNKGTTVSVDTIDKAISLGRYFLEHAKYAYALAGNDKALKRAKYVLLKIKDKEYRSFKLWELEKDCRNKMFRRKAYVREALQLLEECGYVKIMQPEIIPGPGRKPDEYVKVNPLVFQIED